MIGWLSLTVKNAKNFKPFFHKTLFSEDIIIYLYMCMHLYVCLCFLYVFLCVFICVYVFIILFCICVCRLLQRPEVGFRFSGAGHVCELDMDCRNWILVLWKSIVSPKAHLQSHQNLYIIYTNSITDRIHWNK